MKVYGGCFDGRHRQVVAAKNQTEAARLLGVSLYIFRLNASETGNPGEVLTATTAPGKVFTYDVRTRELLTPDER